MNTTAHIRSEGTLHPHRLIITLLTAALLLRALGVQAAVTFTNLYSFTGANDGAAPEGSLIQGDDGSFYGTTVNGGSNGYGSVFKISPSGAFMCLHSFTAGSDGANPNSGLVQGTDGFFYGTATGGSNSSGTVFKIAASGVFTVFYAFTNVLDGTGPLGGVIQGRDGDFYGTTFGGGTHGVGTIFRITPGGVFSSLYSFTGGVDGEEPHDSLVQGSDGNFYGTTWNGGTSRVWGTIFKISATGAFTSLYSFTNGNDGALPVAGLVKGNDGNFYGTTKGTDGGKNTGTVFKISSSGAFSIVYAFTNGTNGTFPYAGLAQGNDGNFYGATTEGGTNRNYGNVFRITPNGVFTSLYSFSGGTNGTDPIGGLVQGSDGNFYGTTYGGGTDGSGTVFRISVGLPGITGIPMDAAFGVSNGMFGFDVSAPVGSNVVIQASADLQNWTPLQTNLMSSGLFYFSDPQSALNPQRFYRAVLPQ